jgi:CheY-like chemotaxis protein
MAMLNKILYVDDEPDIREVATLALDSVGGYTVAVCASGGRPWPCCVGCRGSSARRRPS